MTFRHHVDPVEGVPSRRSPDHTDRAQGSGLVATGLRHAYGTLTALDLDAFTIAPGDRHAVIGPHGAGKSTLFGLLSGSTRVRTGHLTYNGQAITRRGPAWRTRAGIGRVFQHPALHRALTCLEAVRIGGWLHRHTPDRAPLELLDLVGLSAHAHTPAATLAHGQRRMLDLATALAAQPRMLLLDEPTTGLDDTDTARLLDILRGLPHWTALVFAGQDMTVAAALADWVTVLHQGRRHTDGPTDQVLADPTVTALHLRHTHAARR